MSNVIRAFGWSGHILVPSDEMDSNEDHNVIAISADAFVRLLSDHLYCKIDERIHTELLGVTCVDIPSIIAAGIGFSEGFTHYGTVFEWSELQSTPGEPFTSQDAEYLAAMKEIYGLDLPPCRLMVGCSSEA